MLSIGGKPDAVNRSGLTFQPRWKLLSSRMLLFGGVFWPFGSAVFSGEQRCRKLMHKVFDIFD